VWTYAIYDFISGNATSDAICVISKVMKAKIMRLVFVAKNILDFTRSIGIYLLDQLVLRLAALHLAHLVKDS